MSERVAADFFYWHESDGEWRGYPEESDDDYDSDDDDDRSLMSYGTDILNVLGWPANTPDDALLFGVELEMEGRQGHYAHELASILGGCRGTKTGTAILKEDGSLTSGRGVELVTLPMTLEKHRASGCWSKWLDSRLQAVAMSGAGTTNCGIHVHINRAALSALTIGKMVVFLNNPDNSAFVTTIAQRRSGSYCSRDGRKKLTAAWRGYSVASRDSSGNPLDVVYNTRYDIINLTGGSTVEVRMFRGNLRPERVLKNIEFCHALVMFCQSAGIVESGKWGNFVTWLRSNAKNYPNLCDYLREHDILPARVKHGQRVSVPAMADA
jgi:hypothetical protein